MRKREGGNDGRLCLLSKSSSGFDVTLGPVRVGVVLGSCEGLKVAVEVRKTYVILSCRRKSSERGIGEEKACMWTKRPGDLAPDPEKWEVDFLMGNDRDRYCM